MLYSRYFLFIFKGSHTRNRLLLDEGFTSHQRYQLLRYGNPPMLCLISFTQRNQHTWYCARGTVQRVRVGRTAVLRPVLDVEPSRLIISAITTTGQLAVHFPPRHPAFYVGLPGISIFV